MDSQLGQYLSTYRNGCAQYTHTSQMITFKGTFMFDNLSEFYRLYCDRLWLLGDKFISGLSERPNKYMPILADIDIKIPLNEDNHNDNLQHFYTQEQVNQIIAIYNDLLKTLIPNLSHHHLVCFVLEKPRPYVSGTCIKNGFHLHWPFIFLSHSDQEIHLLPRVKAEAEQQKIFANLDIDNSSDVIDTNISSKHWLMYGSRKDPALDAYRVTRIVDSRMQPIELETVMQRNHVIDNSTDQPVDMSAKSMSYYLPRILSVHCYGRPIYKVKAGVECVVKQQLHRAENSTATYEQMSMPETIALVRRLMTMIGFNRADHHDTWMHVGWCLFNITQGCLEGLDIWVAFSRQARIRTHVDEARCVWEWNRMKPGRYSLGTLRMWAETDSPQEYEQFCREQQQARINASLGGGHQDLAQFLCDKYRGKYVCASIKENKWYYFNGNRWIKDDCAHKLTEKIDTDIVPRFAQEAQKCYNNIAAEAVGNVSDHTSKSKQIIKTMANLKSQPFRDNVMKACKYLFYDPDFLDKLDENPMLLGFNNGVMDLTTCVFRPGDPSDYISKSCKYDYKEFRSENDPEVVEVLQFWMKVLTEEDERDAFLDFCGKILKGGNNENVFLILTGVGANGKTVAVDFINQALGEYAIKFPTTSITGKETASSAASPELIRSKGCRFGEVSEPDGKDTVNCGVIKRWTGAEMIYGRGLFKDGEEFRPQFKLAYICNKLPKLPADDEAIWRRVLLFVFKSRFPANDFDVPSTWQEQYKKRIFYRDNTLVSRIPQLRQAMMWIMVQRFRNVMRRRVQPPLPKSVVSAKDMYRAENDYYLQFASDVLKRDPNSRISFNDFYTAFKAWYREAFGLNAPPKNEVRMEMINKWGNLHADGCWSGYRVKRLEDQIEEGEAAVVDNPAVEQEEI